MCVASSVCTKNAMLAPSGDHVAFDTLAPAGIWTCLRVPSAAVAVWVAAVVGGAGGAWARPGSAVGGVDDLDADVVAGGQRPRAVGLEVDEHAAKLVERLGE